MKKFLIYLSIFLFLFGVSTAFADVYIEDFNDGEINPEWEVWGEYDIEYDNENGIYHSEQGEGYPNKLSGIIVWGPEREFFYRFEVDIKKSSSTVQSLGFDYILVGSSGVRWEIGLWARDASDFVAHLEGPGGPFDTVVLGPANLDQWYSLSIILHDDRVTMGIDGNMRDLFEGLFSMGQEKYWSGVEIKGFASDPYDADFWLDNIKVYTSTPICKADFNDDKIVDEADLETFLNAMGKEDCTISPPLCDCDIEGEDNDIDGADLSILADEFKREDCP